jgi:4-amino-4-deoxy-L-arabinose transferase-like glycosyltransferase
VRQFIRQNLVFVAAFTLAAAGLRATFIHYFPGVVNDSWVYGDIAKNWLQHGIYGLSGTEEVSATYIRLPGYPAFLAFIFAIFGMEHYRAVLIAQLFIDIGTCFLCCDIALRLFNVRAAKIAFALAALCPFLADYSAAALTETLEVFFTALALDFALRALQGISIACWGLCGLACGAAILLRPDGMLLLIAIDIYIFWNLLPKEGPRDRRLLKSALLVTFLALAPLIPWTVRNWRAFQRFQPLAPRYANEEDEFVPMGFNRWVKTWMADYVSVEEIYWPVPGSEIDLSKLPARAYDNPQEEKATADLISDYNAALHISPQLDQRFQNLAAERIRSHPFRYYLFLPALRIADMWLRPRTEALPPDSRWWEFNDDLRWSALAVGFGVINFGYVLFALFGWLRFRKVEFVALLTLLVVLRSVFLGTLENPEPRYTLELYPIVIVLAGAFFAGRQLRERRVSHAEARAHVF